MKNKILCLIITGWSMSSLHAQTVSVDLTITTTSTPMNMALHSGNLEAAHFDKQNYFIDWYAHDYYQKCRQMDFHFYSWPGSSVSHSLYLIPGDTVAQGPKRIGNGYNGKYLNWSDQSPCPPVQKQGYRVNHAVLDGVNCIDWGVSFAPYAVNWIKAMDAKMIPVINANHYDWNGDKSFFTWMRQKGVYSGVVVAGLELGGNNYSNKEDFPNGGVSYVKNVVNPLCDSVNKYFLGTMVVADVNPPQKKVHNDWNAEVAKSKAGAIRAYFWSTDLLFLEEGQSSKAYVDSIDKALNVYLPERLDLFQTEFPGKKLYIHQWQCFWQPIRGTTLDMLYCSRWTNAIIRYDKLHPGYIIANCFNGNGRINLEKKNPRVSFYALVQQAKLFKQGAKLSEVKSTLAALDCIAVKDAAGNHLRIVNTSANIVSIRSISVDGKKIGHYSGESYYADSPDSKTIYMKEINNNEIPPYSDTVIDF